MYLTFFSSRFLLDPTAESTWCLKGQPSKQYTTSLQDRFSACCLWCLVSYINQTGSWDSLLVGYTFFFLNVTWSKLLDEISIWIKRPSSLNCPAQCGWARSNVLRAFAFEKVEEGEFSLSACCNWDAGLHLPSDWDFLHHRSWRWILRLELEWHHWF